MSEIFYFDFETTGTNPKKDRPVQIGLLKGLENPEIVMNDLVNPGMPIPPGASQIHGIYDYHVADKERDLDGLFRMVTHFYESHVAHGLPILAGFNSSTYDTPLADNCYGVKVFGLYPQLDVLDVLYRYYPELPKKKLGLVYKTFFGKELEGAHGAVEDCFGTAELLNYILRDQNVTVGDLVKELKTPVVYDIMPIGKHTGLEIDQVPRGWAKWMYENAKDMRPDLDKTIDYILFER